MSARPRNTKADLLSATGDLVIDQLSGKYQAAPDVGKVPLRGFRNAMNGLVQLCHRDLRNELRRRMMSVGNRSSLHHFCRP